MQKTRWKWVAKGGEERRRVRVHRRGREERDAQPQAEGAEEDELWGQLTIVHE